MDFEPRPPVPFAPPAGGPQEAAASIAQIGSPIADLSYRNYDGPLRMRAVRWGVVSAAVLRAALRSPVFWIGAGVCLLAYLAQGVGLYFQIQMKQSSLSLDGATPAVNFATSFFSAQCGTLTSFGLLIVALRIGAGSIAADNRTNALLVYLSKPITKSDYLLGKWVGLFVTMFLVTLLPALLFYLYCALSYSGDGFFTSDRMLIGRVLLAATVAPLIHASLLIGFSAWSKSPSVAGAVYAGVYLLGGLVAGILGTLMSLSRSGTTARGPLVQHLSISGVIDGLTQNIYRVSLPDMLRSQNAHAIVSDPPPALWALLLLAAFLVAAGIGAARLRIRAVEVVTG
jgi:ABC-2 type transport system permease protein